MSELTGSDNSGQSTDSGSTNTGNPAASETNSQNVDTTPSTSWQDSLSDELKTNPSLKSFDSVENLAKSYVHAQGLIGKKGVFVPDNKATDEEWGKFYDSIGRPKAEEYNLDAPKDVKVNEKLVSTFKDLAHKNGLLPKQAQAILEGFVTQEQAMHTEVSTDNEAQKATAIKELRTEWGAGYGKKIEQAKVAINEFGSEGFREFLDSKGLSDDVHMIKLLANMGATLSEDKLRGEFRSTEGNRTPDNIQARLDAVLADPAYT